MDPKAEDYYEMTPYNAMGNNPIIYSDPHGDAIPLIAMAVAAVGGGIINTASNWGNISNFWDGLNYFVVGAGGYGTSVVNPVAGAAILTGGNLLTSGLNGSLAKSWDNGTFGWDVGFAILDGISAGVTGKALNSTFNAGGKLTAAEIKILKKEGIKTSIDEAAGIGIKTSYSKAIQSVVVNQTPTMSAKQWANTVTNQLGQPINKTVKGLQHVIDRHTYNDIARFSNKSKFTNPDEISKLINEATHHPMKLQPRTGNYERVINARRNIGIDMKSGNPTAIYTVITKPNGNLVTALPGTPF